MRCTTRARVSSKIRTLAPSVDLLEARQLLSTGQIAQGPYAQPIASQVSSPMFEVGKLVSNTSPQSGSLTPAQVATAYGFSSIKFGSVQGDGTGQTIDIIDAYDDPNIQADLNTFDTQFGLPAATVTRVNESGGTSLPGADSTGGWEMEESLDVEWAHAIAPGAKIVLVEANSASDSDLLAGVNYAASNANVVSMSWGGGEFSGENSYDGDFSHPGVVFVASSGDNGAPIEWPAASPNVLAVGGTALTLGAGNTYGSETGWSGSGGGPSAYESQPAYQSGVVTQTTTRANPDVAYDASPSTGFAVYDSYPDNGTSYGWLTVGGTSAGAPQWAALIAIADQGRALNHQPAIDSASAQELQTTLYKNATSGAFHDITSGTSTGATRYSASAGYDYVTGIGSPVANLVVQAFDGSVSAPAGDTLAIAAPTSATAGVSFSVTVTARGANGVDAGYAGTVSFSSTDQKAGLPSSYTFTANDAGSHTFTVTLDTAGSRTITATGTGTTAAVTTPGIAVGAAAASQFVVSGLASTATAGSPQSFTVTAEDPFGNVATGYAGTVNLSSSDAGAGFSPGTSYTFTTADGGKHGFSATFATAGSQTVKVADAASGFSATSSAVSVSPAAPINLTATAATSGAQINLGWSSAAGATGYTIYRGTSATGTFTAIASGVTGTTYQDATGLSAGTTYYYYVKATGAGQTSAGASNTASATTAGTPPALASDTLWSNAYTPPENSYASGSYEVGEKFQSSVAGTVTGVRFYKQTWMGGYAHVGHLWSSTGQLLATATFTNESSYGWQQVSFSNPVSIAAHTTYIISFSTGGGYFGITTGYFSNGAYTNGPLQALANSTSGGDGVYGRGGAFPTTNGGGMNFWADVVFSPSSGSSAVAANSTGAVAVAPPVGSGNVAPTGARAGSPDAGRAPQVVAAVTIGARVIPQGPTPASSWRRVAPSSRSFGL